MYNTFKGKKSCRKVFIELKMNLILMLPEKLVSENSLNRNSLALKFTALLE
jgi:hypothetical protein